MKVWFRLYRLAERPWNGTGVISAFMNSMAAVLLIAASGLALSSCSEDEDENNSPVTRRSISFIPMEIHTRAAQTTAGTLDTYGVSASIYDSGGTFSSAGCGSYFYNSKVVTADGKTEYYWPGKAYRLSFFAFAPYGNSNISISPASTLGRPTYTMQIPYNADEQYDFMTAEVLDQSGEGTDKPVKLVFSHMLSDISYSIANSGSDDITVHSVSLYGLRYQGALNGEEWTLQGNVNSSSSNPFILTLDNVISGGATVDVSGSANHMMVLPQTISAGTEFISVDATVAGERKTYVYNLKDDLTLQQGKSYNFKITLGVSYIDVDTVSDIQDWEVDVKYLTIDGISVDGNMSQRGVDGSNVTGVEDWVKQ